MKKVFLVILFFSTQIFSQTISDALRFSLRPTGSGSRAISMGNAYIGVSDDFTSTMWNPAGLAQLNQIEVVGGFNSTSYNNKATFFGNTNENDITSFSFDNFGLAIPLPTERGSMVFAFGYLKNRDYARTVRFEGFNPKSSIIPALFDVDAKYDIPFQTYLSNSKGYSAIIDSVTQYGESKESGQQDMWVFSGAVDIAKNLSLGVTLNFINGDYKFEREFIETDTENKYNNTTPNLPNDSLYLRYNRFYLDNLVETKLEGFGATFGLMYRYFDRFRFGLTIATPTLIKANETYSDAGESLFDNGKYFKYSYGGPNTPVLNNYSVLTPWVLSGGVAIKPFDAILISVDAEKIDYSQIAWEDNSDLEKTNISLQKNFKEVTNLRAGFELQIPDFFYLHNFCDKFLIRGGYSLTPSPYKNDSKEFDQKSVSVGAGIYFDEYVSLDLAIVNGNWKTYHNNYSLRGVTDPSRTEEKINTSILNFTLSYRF